MLPLVIFNRRQLVISFQAMIPRCSINGKFAYIWAMFGVNVGIHIPAPWFANMGLGEVADDQLVTRETLSPADGDGFPRASGIQPEIRIYE